MDIPDWPWDHSGAKYSETCLERPLPCKTTCLEGPLLFGIKSYILIIMEPVTKDHLSWETIFLWPLGWSFKTGSTVINASPNTLLKYWFNLFSASRLAERKISEQESKSDTWSQNNVQSKMKIFVLQSQHSVCCLTGPDTAVSRWKDSVQHDTTKCSLKPQSPSDYTLYFFRNLLDNRGCIYFSVTFVSE